MNADTKVALDTMWVLITAFLVFFMNAGFAMFESGLCRSKNTVNILAKNFVVFGVSALAFWLAGFALMFGDGNGVIGHAGWLLHGADNSPATGAAYRGVYTALAPPACRSAKFFFQMVFAGPRRPSSAAPWRSASSSAPSSLFAFVLVAIIYPSPATGWRGGWRRSGLVDFAGATVVHSVGGWAASERRHPARAARSANTCPTAMRGRAGHNMTAATLGAFILWLGWFGFNAGSTMAAEPTRSRASPSTPHGGRRRRACRRPSWRGCCWRNQTSA